MSDYNKILILDKNLVLVMLSEQPRWAVGRKTMGRSAVGLMDGKVVVITGAGRGIGRSHALRFAAEGAKLVVNDVGLEIASGAEGSGVTQPTDERDAAVAGDVVDEIRARAVLRSPVEPT